MKNRSYIAHGTELYGLASSPVELPKKGEVKWRLDINLNSSDIERNKAHLFSWDASVHGKQVMFESNRKLNFDHVSFDPYQFWKITIEGVATFFWKNDSEKIYVSPSVERVSQKLVFWLLHSIIPLNLLVREKTIFLHAAGIEANSKALLFLAPSLGGKSTLTGKFIEKGYKLVSDDKVAIYISDDCSFAVPSYPYYRPHRNYEDLGYYVNEFCLEHLQVHALYILKRDMGRNDVNINEVVGLNKFDNLIESTLYSPHTLSPKVMSFLLELSGTVNMYEVVMPDDIDFLDDVYRAIRDHPSNTRDDRHEI